MFEQVSLTKSIFDHSCPAPYHFRPCTRVPIHKRQDTPKTVEYEFIELRDTFLYSLEECSDEDLATKGLRLVKLSMCHGCGSNDKNVHLFRDNMIKDLRERIAAHDPSISSKASREERNCLKVEILEQKVKLLEKQLAASKSEVAMYESWYCKELEETAAMGACNAAVLKEVKEESSWEVGEEVEDGDEDEDYIIL